MRRSTLLVWLHLGIAATLLAMLIAQPVLIDTLHMDDTILLTNLGWRGVNGLQAVIDYPHFYGGLIARFMTGAFTLFGVSFKSVDYAFAMIWLACVAVVWGLGWPRLQPLALALLTTLSAVLVLTLAPLELGRLDQPRIAHSFVYNHAAIILMMGLAVFALRKAAPGVPEILRGVLAGVAIYALILLKTTFGLFGVSVVLACLVQMRWLSTATILIGAGLGMLALDFGMVRVLGSLEHLLNSQVSDDVSIDYMVFKTVDIVFSQFLAVLLTGFVIFRYSRAPVATLVPVTLLLAGYGTALLTMGGESDLTALPILVVFALVLTEPGPDRTDVSPLRLLPFAMAHVIIVPAFGSAVLAFAISVGNRDAPLVAEGPASSYFVATYLDLKPSGEAPDLSARVGQVLRTGLGRGPEPYKYATFADGIALLQDTPGIEVYGIVPNARMFDFAMAIGSPPVASFPVWPTGNLAYFNTSAPLADDVEAVMLSIEGPARNYLNDPLRRRMGQDFVACRTSVLWTLYVRRTLPEELCAPS